MNENKDVSIEDIVVEYKNNGITAKLVELLNVFSKKVIKNRENDPYWTDNAEYILEMLLLCNLIDKQEVNIETLIEQTNEAEISKNIIKNNINKFDNPELEDIKASAVITDFDKAFKSVLEIVHNSVVIYDINK